MQTFFWYFSYTVYLGLTKTHQIVFYGWKVVGTEAQGLAAVGCRRVVVVQVALQVTTLKFQLAGDIG